MTLHTLSFLMPFLILLQCQKGANVDDAGNDLLSVEQVSVTGAGPFTFQVTTGSPDTGCNQYADWWEIISEDGDLLFRRILLHSHVSEQPFTRSGGPVDVETEQIVIIRGHMNNTGYSNKGMIGSVKDGFSKIDLEDDFGKDLEKMEPLPDGCDF